MSAVLYTLILSLTVGAIAGVAASVGLAAKAVATTSADTVAKCGVGGGLVVGGASRFVYARSFSRMYKEIKHETTKLRSVLNQLQAGQVELQKSNQTNKDAIELHLVSE